VAILLDTNVLLRLAQPQSLLAPIAEQAIRTLRRKQEKLNIAAQNLFEFWAVATRPQAGNGLGFTVQQASQEIARLKHFFAVIPEQPLLSEWERLVSAHQVSGKNAHDARLVAAMNVNGVGSILTFNVQDFVRYIDIKVLDPRTVT
jgi:predicted nucleic acid-binding protein